MKAWIKAGLPESQAGRNAKMVSTPPKECNQDFPKIYAAGYLLGLGSQRARTLFSFLGRDGWGATCTQALQGNGNIAANTLPSGRLSLGAPLFFCQETGKKSGFPFSSAGVFASFGFP